LAARLSGTGPGRTRVGPSNLPTVLAEADGQVDVRVFGSAAQEAAWIADGLRRAHLQHGVPWSQMAVLSRSARRSLPVLRRALLAAGVPIAVPPDGLPLARQPAVVPLLMVLRYAARPDALDADAATALLTSPLGSADPLRLRRLRRGLLRLHAAGAPAREPAGDGALRGGAPDAPAPAGSSPAPVLGAVLSTAAADEERIGSDPLLVDALRAARGQPDPLAALHVRDSTAASGRGVAPWRERPSARAPVPSRCCGGSGRPRTWSNGGSNRRARRSGGRRRTAI
jgi:hypothetical protein